MDELAQIFFNIDDTFPADSADLQQKLDDGFVIFLIERLRQSMLKKSNKLCKEMKEAQGDLRKCRCLLNSHRLKLKKLKKYLKDKEEQKTGSSTQQKNEVLAYCKNTCTLVYAYS